MVARKFFCTFVLDFSFGIQIIERKRQIWGVKKKELEKN